MYKVAFISFGACPIRVLPSEMRVRSVSGEDFIFNMCVTDLSELSQTHSDADVVCIFSPPSPGLSDEDNKLMLNNMLKSVREVTPHALLRNVTKMYDVFDALRDFSQNVS